MDKRIIVLIVVSLCGCAGLSPASTTPLSTPPSTPTLTSAPTAITSQAPASTPSPSGPIILRLWVPPQFDPNSGTPAGDLLKMRLDEFSQRNPGVRIEARVKAVTGTGGLLDSLITTSSAAPMVMPDLIALPRELLEAAALKGILHPYDNLTNLLDSSDWYDYARQLARIQNSIFGLPFAGDALTLVYRPEVIPEPPEVWTTTLQSTEPMIFPAADPQALFTIALYQASGGAVRDEDGRPFLDAEILTQVFTYYMLGERFGVMPSSPTQYASYNQVWEIFKEKHADLVVAWSSSYLGSMPADTAIASIPTQNKKLDTLATGWVWALATLNPERRALSVELAEFLVESNFLISWTAKAGYLPTRPSVLSAWSNPPLRSTLNQIAFSARLLPSTDVLASLGGPLQGATLRVLKKESDPATAAQAAVAGLTAP